MTAPPLGCCPWMRAHKLARAVREKKINTPNSMISSIIYIYIYIYIYTHMLYIYIYIYLCIYLPTNIASY